MSKVELARAYDALQQADEAGNKEDAQQIADYIRELEAQEAKNLESDAQILKEQKFDEMASDPFTYGVIGAGTGLVAGPLLTKGVDLATPAPLKPGAAPIGGPAVPPTTPATPAGGYQSQHGFHPGATSNAQFNLQQAQANPLAKAGANLPGYHVPGNSRLILPTTIGESTTPAAVPQPIPKKLTPKQKATMMMQSPEASKPGVVGRMYGSGMAAGQAADAINQAKQGNIGQAAISGIGSVGGVASMSSNPKLRLLGRGITTAAPILRSMTAPEEKAMGGVVGYAKGKAVKGGLDAIKKAFTPKQTNVVRASEALGQHEGKWLNTTQSDRMRSTGGDLGGPGFSKFQLERPEYADAAWGVGKKATASGIVNANKRYPEGQAIWSPMIGSEVQHHSNQHVFDALTDEFNRQAAMGKLTPELREKMNYYLMNKKEYAPLFKKGIDVGNPESLAAMGDTFDRRGALSTVLSGKGVGGQKGQIFDYPGIMQEMTDPMTIGAPTHSVGTRLFSLNNEIEHRPDLHSAFPYILKGEDAGVAFTPVPKELAIPDWLGLVRDFKGREPGYMDYTRGLKGKGTPFQFIDDKYLRALEEAGHAEGGSTTPAWQRKEGKNPEGGLNAAGRASYNRETGGNLKAPQPEGGPRKKSFCARMEGMKRKNTSSATANDPDSRINKSLRKWKC
jgi:hypothetical protein